MSVFCPPYLHILSKNHRKDGLWHSGWWFPIWGTGVADPIEKQVHHSVSCGELLKRDGGILPALRTIHNLALSSLNSGAGAAHWSWSSFSAVSALLEDPDLSWICVEGHSFCISQSRWISAAVTKNNQVWVATAAKVCFRLMLYVLCWSVGRGLLTLVPQGLRPREEAPSGYELL